MRVLQISSAKDWAGGEVHTFLLCKELIKLGCDVILGCRPNSALSKVCRKESLPVINILLLNSVDILSVIHLALICWFKRIDIIHVQIARDSWLAYGAKILCPRVKIIFTRHVLYPLKYFRFHNHLYDNIEKIIAVSQAVEDVVVNQNIIPRSKISTIHNGIDLERFESAEPADIRKELNLEEDTPLVGIIGRVDPEKGQNTFIKSITDLANQHPKANFLIVGQDSSQGNYINELKLLAEQQGVIDKVKFLGFRSDIPNILKDLDIFVLASVNEPFGLVLVEAMAAGTPIVATRAGGAKEIIVQDESGLFFESGDSQELAVQISKILASKELANNLSIAGQERSKLFGINIMAQKTFDLYKEMGVQINQ